MGMFFCTCAEIAVCTPCAPARRDAHATDARAHNLRKPTLVVANFSPQPPLDGPAACTRHIARATHNPRTAVTKRIYSKRGHKPV